VIPNQQRTISSSIVDGWMDGCDCQREKKGIWREGPGEKRERGTKYMSYDRSSTSSNNAYI